LHGFLGLDRHFFKSQHLFLASLNLIQTSLG
jgi:hypothetical protein